MLAALTVPDPLVIKQVNPLGWLWTLTVYAVPVVKPLAKLKVVAPLFTILLAPLRLKTNPEAVSPEIVPLTV